MADGWEPHGSPVYSPTGLSTFTQAIVRPKVVSEVGETCSAIHGTVIVAQSDPGSVDAQFRHLTSEVGELAIAISVEQGLSSKKLDEPAAHEAVDVLLSAIGVIVALKPNLSSAEILRFINDVANLKNEKWATTILNNWRDA